MRRTLLSLSAAVLASAAFAFSPESVIELQDFRKAPASSKMTAFKAPARAEEEGSMPIGLAGEVENAYSLKADYVSLRDTIYMAFCLTKKDQEPYIGTKITAVNIMSGPQSTDQDKCVMGRAEAYVTTDENQPSKYDKSEVFGTQMPPFEYQTVALSEPVEITGKTDLYIGYRFTLTKAGYYLTTDDVPVAGKNMLVAVCKRGKTNKFEYTNLASQIGSLCCQAVVTGDNLPKDIAVAKGITMNGHFDMSTKLSYKIKVKNAGSNKITSLVVASEISNGSVFNKTVSLAGKPIEPGQYREVEVTNVPNENPGLFTLTAKIMKVNGVETVNPEGFSTSYSAYDNGYPRRIVIEEGTGVLCGWCPRGIVMMEYFKEHYPDWIRIAVHGAYGNDPMTPPTYQGMIRNYFPGAPSAVANRYASVVVAGDNDEYYKPIKEYFESYPAMVNLNLKAVCSEDKTTVNVTAVSEFSIPVTDTDIRLAFVLVEDGVGPYDQENYYSGGGSGVMGGWEKKGSSVSTMYDDVARYLDGYPGIRESLPETIEQHTPYTFERPISLSKVKNESFRLVGMVVNAVTGEILNANELKLNKDNSGVDGIMEDNVVDFRIVDGCVEADGEVEVYTLDGCRVGSHNLAKGMYIITVNGKPSKVLVK